MLKFFWFKNVSLCVVFFLGMIGMDYICVSDDIFIFLIFEVYFKDVKFGLNFDENIILCFMFFCIF